MDWYPFPHHLGCFGSVIFLGTVFFLGTTFFVFEVVFFTIFFFAFA